MTKSVRNLVAQTMWYYDAAEITSGQTIIMSTYKTASLFITKYLQEMSHERGRELGEREREKRG